MARRKAVSKTKIRKMMNTTAKAVEGDSKLKDDPGGGKPQAMDEINYLPDIKNQATNQSEISKKTPNNDHHHYHKYNLSHTHFPDLKYLHKKFKRVASTTVVDNVNTPVIDSPEINSDEFKIYTSNQPQNKEEIKDQLTNKIQSFEQESLLIRENLKQDILNEKLELSTKANSLSNQQNHCHTTTSNGFMCSDIESSDCPVTISNVKYNNFAQSDIANIDSTKKKSANSIVSNSSSINSVNTTKLYLIPTEIPNQHKTQQLVRTPDNKQQSSAPYTLPVYNTHQIMVGKSILSDCSVTSPTRNYQTIGDISRLPPSKVQSIPILQVPNQSKMLYQQSHTDPCHAPGRYACPYCHLNCTKPSVLEKHIRSHTNERPYPCETCGFAFKTRSNLYKHCRSRAHALRTQGGEPQPEDEVSLGGSDQEQDVSSSASSDVISGATSPTEDRVSSPSSQQAEKPYKPKFHNAALYADDQQKHKIIQQQLQPTTLAVTTSSSVSMSHPLTTQNVEYLKERISKIISDNETIMEVVEAPLKKKYRKITGISRGHVINDNATTKLTIALLKQREESQNNANNNVNNANHQPITTSAPSSPLFQSTFPTLQEQAQLVLRTTPHFCLNASNFFDSTDNQRKRRCSEGIPSAQEVATHPQNPERSIIKDLLLNSRGLAVPTGEGDDAVYTCPLCKISFRSADNLQYHTKCYCQGIQVSTPQSAPISPVGSPSHKYFRSNSVNVNLPEKYNPNTLAKLASTTLRHPNQTPLSLAKLAQTKIKPGRSKPENIVINKDTCPAPTPQPTQSLSVQCAPIAKLIDAPLPSPGPLLGKTRLVDTYNADRMTEEAVVSHFTSERDAQSYNMKSYSTDDKIIEMRPRTDSYSMNSPIFVPSMEQVGSPNSRLLMCGGDLKIVERKETVPKFGSSGGSIVSVSPPPLDSHTPEPFGIRSGLLSGGGAVDVDVPSNLDSRTPEPFGIRSGLLSGGGAVDVDIISPKDGTCYVITPTLTPKHVPGKQSGQYFQFPPISPIITGYNPLTLPPVQPTNIIYGGRIIPHVPGIPGPNSLSPRPVSPLTRIPSPTNRRLIPSPLMLTSTNILVSSSNITPPKFTIPTTTPVYKASTTRSIPYIKIDDSDEKSKKFYRNGISDLNAISTNSSIKQDAKKTFLFARVPANLSPWNELVTVSETMDADIRYFNFDNLTIKTEVKTSHTSPLHIDVSSSPVPQSNRSEDTTLSSESTKSTKFLRPSSLPLKPGTFTPKRHHGITPTANTLPLISPETPRPSKSCVQLYLNGHAYTYLGLKCSTKTFYCTVNRPQPVHFTNQHKLSIYSNWQICAESDPHPLGFTPKTAMSLYDSRQQPTKYTMAKTSPTCTTLHSQSLIVTPIDNNKLSSSADNSMGARNITPVKPDVHPSAPPVSGGYESNEVYTYVRGRGRGRYVCSECGIRCKKPSMLKKHIRTHSDVRPYTCQHCLFSFKTKGNLTKHMKSKAHYKKCVELGLTPLPPSVDDDGLDDDTEGASMTSGDLASTVPDDSDSDDMSDGEEGENDSSDTSDFRLRLPEHEAARGLLYLSQTPPGNTPLPNLIPVRPMTYPYGDQPSQIHTQSLAEQLTARRVISFQTSPSFEYSSKNDQYYANPKLSIMNQKFEDSNSMPIDLTKPRHSQHSLHQVNSIHQHSGDIDSVKASSGFLTTLVLNNEKSLTHHVIPHAVDEIVFMQTYSTEKALLDSKMKQSQMYRIQHSVSSSTTASSTTTTSSITSTVMTIAPLEKSTYPINSSIDGDLNSGTHSIDKKAHQMSLKVVSAGLTSQSKPHQINDKGTINSQNGKFRNFDKLTLDKIENRLDRTDDSISGMDTLAEIAASSVKLDITQNRVNYFDTETTNLLPGQQSNSAKSVASEYLKMTSAEFLKAHQYKSDREESEESGVSEDETAALKSVEFGGVLARKVVVGEDGFKGNAPDYTVAHPRILIQEDGRSACLICSKTFPKKHQMILHMNIHYMERKFRCEPCTVSFRTQGHLQKHERSEAHKNKVLMTTTFGNVTTSNPRPFECSDCNIAFRIHGHLAKHLRSKTHVQKLECLQKLPFGTYAEIERAGISLTDIDTTDCHNSLTSLKLLAQRLLDKDPSKLSSWSHGEEQQVRNYTNESRESNSDGEPIYSPDDESIGESRISDREASTISVPDDNIFTISVKRKSEINGLNEIIESGVENHEKRLKIFTDT